MDWIFLFYILLFIVAFLYASVGHGGASGYLALMALFSFTPDVMKPTALMLNLFVSLTSFIQYYRGGHFKLNLFLPFAAASIPMSFIGGSITLHDALYKQVLGVLLLIPVARFIFLQNESSKSLQESNVAIALIIGALIGLLSGMIGIGGGIILSPVLLMLRWSDMKQTAAVSALFIFVNSLAGLAGQFSKGLHFTSDMYLYVVVAFIGGIAGAYIGAKKISNLYLQYLLAVVLFIASVKLLFV